MKILITGGNGYVAKSLYNALKDKYDVTAITRDNFDLTNRESTNIFFTKKYFDVVIHCAIEGGSRLVQDDWKVMDDNLCMYYNLLSNKHCFNKFIHFGSGAETHLQHTPYGLSKHVIRQSILEKENFYNLRIFAVFDENEWDTRFIKANIKHYINREPMQIYQNKNMDFFYIPDLVKLVEYYIVNSDLPKEANCHYGNMVSLKNIVNLINNLDDYKVEIEFGDGSSPDYIGEEYHNLPIEFIGLEQGIKETYNKLKNK
jgi:GDP-L-fucose synthase